MAMFLNLLRRWESAELNQEEAAELLGVDVRTVRRWTRRYEEDGEAGLLDRRLGKASGKRTGRRRWNGSTASVTRGFTVKHFHEHLVKDHGFGWGYPWLKLHLQWRGVAAKAPRKDAHRRKRERRPLPGMMLHQDGARHAWLEGQPPLDLIVTLDDATGEIYSAFLVKEEGTASTFRALKDRLAVRPVKLDRAAAPARGLCRNQRRARTRKAVDDDVAAVRDVDESVFRQQARLHGRVEREPPRGNLTRGSTPLRIPRRLIVSGRADRVQHC